MIIFIEIKKTNMKKTYILIASVFAMGYSVAIQAQTRYLDDVGTEVSVIPNIIYGNNVGIITQAPALEPLKMDVYQLEGDTTSNKPVVIMLHTGSFLPAIVNGQATGDKSDNAIVEMCERFAKKGYLAIALNYRLGWNPVSTSEDVRRSTLIQAAYRSLQDVKTAVRFLRKSVAEEGNPYGIGEEFAVGGYGTGGYIALSVATLNDYNSELLMPKFIDSSEETIAEFGQPVPYIMQSMWGNFDATDYGWHPAYPDSTVALCVPNHVGYSSEINMAFNAGGALPDISWLDEGEIPIASMQCITDPDAPYAEGNVIVPTTGEFVITAHGAQWIQEKADSLGNNAVFNELTTTLTDSWYNNGNGADNAAVAGHDDLNGLFGIVTPAPSEVLTGCGFQTEQGAPWDWWDNEWYTGLADTYHGQAAGTMGCLALLGNPDMSEEKGMAMADMMSEFFTPRVYVSLVGPISDIGITEELVEKVNIYPNPANNFITINANNNTISSVKLYSVEGKLLRNYTTNSTSVIIEKNGLTNGLYFVELEINKQTIKKSVVFN
jgi:dienelactone hydrolase